MYIIKDLEFTKAQLVAIKLCHTSINSSETNAILEKLHKVIAFEEDVEITLTELWKLFERSNPDQLQGTLYEHLANEVLPRLDKAMNDYIFMEGHPATITLGINLHDLFNLIGCTEENEEKKETTLLFIVDNNQANSEQKTSDKRCFLKFEKKLFLKMFESVIDRKASIAYMYHTWESVETISLFCWVDNNPAYKHPMYVVLDYLLEVGIAV